MEAGKMINKISNRLRRRSKKTQEILGITGAKGNILNYILVESERPEGDRRRVWAQAIHCNRSSEAFGRRKSDCPDSG